VSLACHVPQDRAQLRATHHCYKVSPADAQGNILPDDQVMTSSIQPAVLPAVTGQQAVGNTAWMYAVNNSLE